MSHGLRGSAGVHWASGTTSRRTPFDIGVGAVYERDFGGSELAPVAEKAAMEELPSFTDRYGGYVEGAMRLSGHGSHRAWIGGRAEILGDSAGDWKSMALVGRVSWELYGNGSTAAASGDLDKGVAMFASTGTIGLGAYVESGVRHLASHENEFIMTAGLSLRLPAFLGFYLGWR